MMQIKRLTPQQQELADAHLFFMQFECKGAGDQELLARLEAEYAISLKLILERYQFKGKRGDCVVYPLLHQGKLIHLIFIGLGAGDKPAHQELEFARRAFARAVSPMKQYRISAAQATIPGYLASVCAVALPELCKQLSIAFLMAAYDFDTYKSEKKHADYRGSILLCLETSEEEACDRALNEAAIIAQAINQARHWADTPGNIMTPTALSQEAQLLADKYGLACTIFGKERALELGMGSFLSVDQGSAQDGKFVVLEYTSTVKDAPVIALCGKGITFDTGGISLKPSNSMDGMKFDMSGAAAVIAAIAVIAQLKPAISVVAIAPLTENMPSGTASRQDDIVRAMNGKTIEIKNTDAEGRLILADALCYAEKFYSPAVIIDIATLTGACAYALGHFYSAVMTRDAQLAEQLIAAGKKSGDRIWELPLDDDFIKANASEVADVNNSGSRAYLAGTIIGACFLENFVSKSRWAHLDIAGTAHDVPDINYVGRGATGAGIRALIEFIMQYGK